MEPTLLEAALAYAERGWPVFPCRADKTPYTDKGVLDATTDRAKIRKWWQRWPKANIAMNAGEAGLMVLDLDPGHDLAQLQEAVGPLPKTALEQSTPRGGRHLFYAIGQGEVVSPSSSKLAPHVDVRSFNSYVLLAPSRTKDGVYSWLGQGKPSYRTDEMVRLTNSAREKHEDRDKWIIEPDLPENVAAAIAWLALDAKPAIEGQGGDHMMYATAAMLKSYGISEAMAFDLIWEHYNPRCQPPWGEDQIEHLEAKIENGYAYNTSPPGNMTASYKEAKARELFKPVRQELPSGSEMRVGRFRFVDRAGMNHIQPPEWLVENLLPAGSYGVMWGRQGTFKSFVALDIALSIASPYGVVRPTWGKVRHGSVVYSLGEGRAGLRKRVAAWEAVHTEGAPVDRFYMVDPVPHAFDDEGLTHFIEGVDQFVPKGENIELLVIDTIGRAMQGLNENSAEDVSKFTRMIERIQRELECAVLCLAHTGKDGSPRGSTVFLADADTGLLLDRDAESKPMFTDISMIKQKDYEEWQAPRRVHVEKVELGDMGTSLAIAQPKPVEVLEGQEIAQAHRAQAESLLRERQEARRGARGPASAVDLDLVDRIACEVLEAAGAQPLNDVDLSIRIHDHPQIENEVTAETIRKKYLKRFKESKAYKMHAYYHVKRPVAAGRWLARAKA